MPAQPWRIVVAESFSDEAIEKLGSVGLVTQLHSCDEQALIDAIPSCHALLVRTASQVTRKVIESAPNLKVIARGGVGLDNIDVQAAREHKVCVVYTPHAATNAVADLTFALILSLIWDLRSKDLAVRDGRFIEARNVASPRELRGLTLGIIGVGRIGRAVAHRAVNGFLMEVHYNDIMKPDPPLDLSAQAMEKDEVYQTSDIISLHVPLTEQTRGMIGAQTLAQFKPGAVLINTSRGAVVNLAEVHQSLRSGHLGGAGFDVYDCEPVPKNHPILEAPNTIFTPHIGARTACAQRQMNAVVDDVIRVLEGQEPRHEAACG